MSNKVNFRLLEAEAYFFSLRIPEAYQIFRRYFDRLPFQVDPDHNRYIALFVRCLLELGKEHELDFYISELRKRHLTETSPEIRFQLGVTFCAKGWFREATKLFESLLSTSSSPILTSRTKLQLAYCYQFDEPLDIAKCRALIDSIKVIDKINEPPLKIWRANLLRLEGHFERAWASLLDLNEDYPFSKNWYAWFYVQSLMARILLTRGDLAKGIQIQKLIKTRFQGKRSISISQDLKRLEDEIWDILESNPLHLWSRGNSKKVRFLTKELTLSKSRKPDLLLDYLFENQIAKNDDFAHILWNRSYSEQTDLSRVEHYLTEARKRLEEIGVPGEYIVTRDNRHTLKGKIKHLETKKCAR